MIKYYIEATSKDPDMLEKVYDTIFFNNLHKKDKSGLLISGKMSKDKSKFDIEVTDNRSKEEGADLEIVFTVDPDYGKKYVKATGMVSAPKGQFYELLHKNKNIEMQITVGGDDSHSRRNSIFHSALYCICDNRMYDDGDIIFEEKYYDKIKITCTEVNGVHPLLYLL